METEFYEREDNREEREKKEGVSSIVSWEYVKKKRLVRKERWVPQIDG